MTLLRPQKRIRLSEDTVDRDRLSELPDDIIVRILSCLPTIDAVRTVLLRPFGNLWTFIHTLDFDMDEYLNNFCDHRKGFGKHIRWFYGFIRNVLMRHQNLSIERFHLCIDTDFKSILPNFTSQFLNTLELEFCKFKGEFQVELRSLKKLSFNRVWISDEKFKRFISGCLSLQELVISNPFEMEKLSLSDRNIDKLSLVLTDVRELPSLLIYVPNLKNLYLEIKNWLLDIVDVSSVRDIYIKDLNFKSSDERIILTINQVLLGKFEGIEVFRLSRQPSKEFLHSTVKLKLLQCKWKRIVLELHNNFCRSCLLGIYHLMTRLQHLEELIIYTTQDFKAIGDLLRINPPSPYVTSQLKTITLYGYAKSWKSQLQLVELLLKSAAALDKLIIVHIGHRLQEEEQQKFVKHVSSFPWASSTARILY